MSRHPSLFLLRQELPDQGADVLMFLLQDRDEIGGLGIALGVLLF